MALENRLHGFHVLFLSIMTILRVHEKKQKTKKTKKKTMTMMIDKSTPVFQLWDVECCAWSFVVKILCDHEYMKPMIKRIKSIQVITQKLVHVIGTTPTGLLLQAIYRQMVAFSKAMSKKSIRFAHACCAIWNEVTMIQLLYAATIHGDFPNETTPSTTQVDQYAYRYRAMRRARTMLCKQYNDESKETKETKDAKDETCAKDATYAKDATPFKWNGVWLSLETGYEERYSIGSGEEFKTEIVQEEVEVRRLLRLLTK